MVHIKPGYDLQLEKIPPLVAVVFLLVLQLGVATPRAAIIQ
jgi:hypothetical protein